MGHLIGFNHLLWEILINLLYPVFVAVHETNWHWESFAAEFVGSTQRKVSLDAWAEHNLDRSLWWIRFEQDVIEIICNHFLVERI